MHPLARHLHDTEYWRELGFSLRRRGDVEAASQAFERVVELNYGGHFAALCQLWGMLLDSLQSGAAATAGGIALDSAADTMANLSSHPKSGIGRSTPDSVADTLAADTFAADTIVGNTFVGTTFAAPRAQIFIPRVVGTKKSGDRALSPQAIRKNRMRLFAAGNRGLHKRY